MRENDLIRTLQRFDCFSSASAYGIGDDCALIKARADYEIIVSTDLLQEQIHFSRAWSSPEQIGSKLVAVNLSDIAAMGGRPFCALLTLAIPPSVSEAELYSLISGINKLALKHCITIIGGDTNSAPSDLSLGMTIFGDVKPGQAKLRSSAKIGDKLLLSRPCGDSALGLFCLKNSVDAPDVTSLHLSPIPEVELGIWLGARPEVNALIDISDGIATDLRHILAQSKVGALLYRDQIPISATLKSLAPRLELDPITLAMCGGEDYALLFSVASDKCDKLLNDVQIEFGRQFFVIGEIIDQDHRLQILSNGKRTLFEASGYEHSFGY